MSRNNDPDVGSPRERFQGAYFICRGLECLWTLVLHHSVGVHYPGLPGFLCFIGLMFYAAMSQSDAVLAFALTWVFTAIWRRVEAVRMNGKGWEVDSTYDGYPGLVMKLFRIKSELRAKSVECLLAQIVSIVVMEYHQELGFLLLMGALGMSFVRVVDSYASWSHTVQVRDAQIRARVTAARIRGEEEE